jgi:hypothetical protein
MSEVKLNKERVVRHELTNKESLGMKWEKLKNYGSMCKIRKLGNINA